MKGIVLAGGRGTRLSPLTLGVSKQLMPVYDKPMIYYPLSILMLAGIKEILIISTPHALPAFRALLGTGAQWGLRFEYAGQPVPRGLADAFLVGKEFIWRKTRGEPIRHGAALERHATATDAEGTCLVLGDNIFFGHGLPEQLMKAARRVEQEGGGTIFAYPVRDPERYGVVEFDDEGRAVTIEEKPRQPKSKYAVPGIYFYDRQVVERAATLKPSARGEIEITDLNALYLKHGELRVEVLGRGVAWLDAGTPEALLQASNFVQAVEERQGLMIASPEEIAFRQGYISAEELRRQAQAINNQYGEFLLRVADGLA